MIKIGIVPAGKIGLTEDPYQDNYTFVNNYMKMIEENGALCIGILPVDRFINEKVLEDCDGFLITGGTIVSPYHLQVIDYALNNNKPLLGICLGIHALGIYMRLKSDVISRGEEYNLSKALKIKQEYKDREQSILIKVQSHSDIEVNRNNVSESKRPVILVKKSKLYSIYQKETIYEPSLHGYAVDYVSDEFKIVGSSPDGVIEAIEHKSKDLIFVQFHPELEHENDCLFKYLISSCAEHKTIN